MFSFKSEVIAAIESQTKITKTKYSLPWIDSSIRRLIRKRDKLYFRARKSSNADVKNQYKRFRAHVQKLIRDAYWNHMSSSFSFETKILIQIPLRNLRRQRSLVICKVPQKRRVWDQLWIRGRQLPGGPLGNGETPVASATCWTNLIGHPGDPQGAVLLSLLLQDSLRYSKKHAKIRN